MAVYQYKSTMPGTTDTIEGIVITKGIPLVYSVDQPILNKYVPSRLDRLVDGVPSNSDLVLPDIITAQEVADLKGMGALTISATDSTSSMTAAQLLGTKALVAGGGVARTVAVRCATFGDSTANVNSTFCDNAVLTTTFAAPASLSQSPEKWMLSAYYPQAYLVANGGVSGDSTTSMLARGSAASSATRKSIQDVLDMRPDVVFLRGGSINNLTGVTSGTLAATVATAFAEHTKIINRFLSARVKVIDESLYAYSAGAATDPVSTRTALLQLDALIQAYWADKVDRGMCIPWVNVIRDTAGNYLPSCSVDGLHPSVYGQMLIAQREALAMTYLFGPSSSERYQGKNLLKNAAVASQGGNSMMALTTSPGYGTVPTGFAWGVQNGTRQNALVEVIDNRYFATCEIGSLTATNAYLAAYSPLDSANFTPAVGDIWGAEFDIYLSGLGGIAPPAFSAMAANFNFTQGNTIYITMLQPAAAVLIPVAGGFVWHVTFPPFQIPSDLTTITAADLRMTVNTDSMTGFKLGMSNPRLVKLGTSGTWPPTAA